jgi:2-polyprenyl-3-methyl-5-hydroxy-6-metoxy-1,4-benzoquinol methylase
MTEEQRQLDKIASWYLEQQLDFDRRMVQFRYQSLSPYLRGPNGLELGSAEGEMTRLLLPHFQSLTVVDGAGDLLARIPNAPSLHKVRSLFEEFQPALRFDTIVMEHVLEHVADPVALLRRAGTWLAPRGRVLVGVPNANSIHRLAAVKMGLLTHPGQLNERDLQLGHRRVYTTDSLRTHIEAGGLHIAERGGVFLKPLSNSQIEAHWDERMIEGFHQLGRDFPDHAAEIFAVCVCDD